MQRNIFFKFTQSNSLSLGKLKSEMISDITAKDLTCFYIV